MDLRSSRCNMSMCWKQNIHCLVWWMPLHRGGSVKLSSPVMVVPLLFWSQLQIIPGYRLLFIETEHVIAVEGCPLLLATATQSFGFDEISLKQKFGIRLWNPARVKQSSLSVKASPCFFYSATLHAWVTITAINCSSPILKW